MAWLKRSWKEKDEVNAAAENNIEEGISQALGSFSTVTVPLGGTGAVAGSELAQEICWRIPIYLPVSTLRWRLKLRNFNCSGAAEEAGVLSELVNAYLGTPLWNAGRWKGALTGAPTKVLGSTSVGSGADVTSAWVEAGANQFKAYTAAALSLALKKPAGKWFLDEFGGVLSFGPGSIAKAAEAGEVKSAEIFGPTSWNAFDIRLEYEYTVGGIANVATLTGLVVGDSIAGGYALTDGGAYQYESWPGVAGLRQGHPILCTGPAGATLHSFDTIGSFRWKRLNLATSPPNYVIVALGVNSVSSEEVSKLEEATTALVKKIQAEICPAVYLATMVPLALTEITAKKEKERVELNEFFRSLPAGVQGVVEFDKQLSLQAEPNKLDPAWGANSAANPHVNRPAYQRMAGALILP